MANEIKTVVALKEPISVIIETKEKEKKEGEKILGLTAVKLEFWKWVIGTLFLAIAGIIINKNIQETELDIKRIEADSKLLDVITKNPVSSDSSEYRYLSFVRTFITTDSIKRAVEIRRIELRILMNDQALTMSRQKTESGEKKFIEQLTPNQIKELKKSASVLKPKVANGKLLSLNVLKEEENKIAGNVTAIDSGVIENLNLAKKIITPAVIENKEKVYALVNSSQTKWCKEGYFIEFNNTLRVGINDLNVTSQTIIVNFKDIEESTNNPPKIQDDVSINVGETYTLDRNSYRYQITLNYIGAAGKNPFTKAAYITVATYRKQ